jgi:hypothetical protein
MHYIDSRSVERRVLRSRNYIQVAGERPVIEREAAASLTLVRAAVRLLVEHGYDAYIERADRPIRERICIGRGDNQYHLTIDWTPRTFAASVLRAAEQATIAIRRRQTERRLTARNAALDRVIADRASAIYVDVADSLAGGNCESRTMEFAREMWSRLHAEGPAAVRADEILDQRKDSYTMRACRVAAVRYA